MLQEFKDFAMKGNVVDLAVGVIIGSAFGKIVSSLVENVLMPFIGLLGGAPDFKGLSLGPIMYGSFIQTVVDFLIIAACLFLVIKAINKAKKPAPAAAPPPPPPSEVYQKEIRDALTRR
jgi:large conductance mechanosensitive channel